MSKPKNARKRFRVLELEDRLKLLDTMLGNILWALEQGQRPDQDAWLRMVRHMKEVSGLDGASK